MKATQGSDFGFSVPSFFISLGEEVLGPGIREMMLQSQGICPPCSCGMHGSCAGGSLTFWKGCCCDAKACEQKRREIPVMIIVSLVAGVLSTFIGVGLSQGWL